MVYRFIVLKLKQGPTLLYYNNDFNLVSVFIAPGPLTMLACTLCQAQPSGLPTIPTLQVLGIAGCPLWPSADTSSHPVCHCFSALPSFPFRVCLSKLPCFFKLSEYISFPYVIVFKSYFNLTF